MTESISNIHDLKTLTDNVNGGTPALDAELLADIDLSNTNHLNVEEWSAKTWPAGSFAKYYNFGSWLIFYTAEETSALISMAPWVYCWDSGGFPMIGNSQTNYYSGTFEGNNFTISNMYINRPKIGTYGKIGFIGYGKDITLSNIILEDVDVSSSDGSVGALVGEASVNVTGNSVTNCHSSGAVSSPAVNAGGLCYSLNGDLANCSSSCTVTSLSYPGGLVSRSSQAGSTVHRCFATGDVTATMDEGVSTTVGHPGGFASLIQNGCAVTECYSTGSVIGNIVVGGFCAVLAQTSTVDDCWSSSPTTTVGVITDKPIGGFCAQGNHTSAFENCHATGLVTNSAATIYKSGFMGKNLTGGTTLKNCYYNEDTTGMADDDGRGEPIADAIYSTAGSFTGFDFNDVWFISATSFGFAPKLKAFITEIDGRYTLYPYDNYSLTESTKFNFICDPGLTAIISINNIEYTIGNINSYLVWNIGEGSSVFVNSGDSFIVPTETSSLSINVVFDGYSSILFTIYLTEINVNTNGTIKQYYLAKGGDLDLDLDKWYIDYSKRHAYKVSSDFDAIDEHNNKINLPPSESETDLINLFSDKLGQKLKNTKITNNEDGTEKIDLELDDRIVTIIMDQSGSMTWNDHNNFRHDIVADLVNKIEINYPGDITYNLIEYGADIIDVLLFGIVENDAFNPTDVNSISKMIKADDKANYDGIRVVRNDNHYPTSVVDGELVDDGFISRIKDEGLVEGQTYYYTIYTYDKDLKFSEGINVKVTPRERSVPRSHSNFRTVVDSEDITKGIPYIGSGVNRDDNTLGIWHMDEGEGKYLYDFSDTKAVLEFNKENPIWYEDRFVPAGNSGLFLDGENDAIEYEDSSDTYEVDFNTVNQFTFVGWIYPYNLTKKQVIFGRSSSGEFNYSINISASGNLAVEFVSEEIEADSLLLEAYKWQHIAVVYNGENPSGSQLAFYVNGEVQNKHSVEASQVFSETHTVSIGNLTYSNLPYKGKITEFSFHNIERDSDYINAQLISNPILDADGDQVDTEFIGIKEDNGDRLVVLEYNVPRDYNYVGGEVLVVRNEKNIPSWEEDGDTIYQELDPGAGQFFISDSDNFVLGEKYYYRLFTKNSLGNISFLSDSPSLEIDIPEDSINDYWLSLDSAIDPPEDPSIGQLITAGNEKIYLRWKQNDPIDSRIARVKIFYSSADYPVVNVDGISNGKLVFTGLTTDTKFVHRELPNDRNAYYTIVNVDKYGRSSNYNEDEVQVEDFLHATAIPNSDADESTFPLIEINNVNYELIDENTITIGWSQPQKSLKNINAFFDQTVYIYGSVTDEFGDAVSEDTFMKMSIRSSINKGQQADDVFGTGGVAEFEDIDAYDFFVTRTSDGFFKGILRLTSNQDILSQINSANFEIQLKALLPKEGGYTPPNDDTINENPTVEYANLIEQLAGGDEEESVSSDNFYEYYSEKITVSFTNPWEIELVNRDDQKVSQRCYYQKVDDTTKEVSLNVDTEYFNGIYMKATNPFVVRAKVKYKGEPVSSGNIQLAVWDSDFSDLCHNAGVENSSPFEGAKLQPSITVLPPDSFLPIVQGEEDDGSGGIRDISFVDIPLYAPVTPNAVRLFVKGTRSGYASVKDMYILFQSILQIDIGMTSDRLEVDGKDIVEFSANAFIINPDYPNYDIIGSIDESLITYPDDLTIVQWKKSFIQTIEDTEQSSFGEIYSTDNVPLTNGIYSYTRSGSARNVFLGPVPKGSKKIHEDHEIMASIVYKGLSSFAKIFLTVGPYDPQTFDRTSARFLMEVDGGWGRKPLPNQEYGGGGWEPAEKWPLWADGIHYKKIKISRNPRTAVTGNGEDEFAYAECFRDCSSNEGKELLELSSGQIVEVGFNLNSDFIQSVSDRFSIPEDKEIEILHGEIYEREDVYTGLHYLEVGEEGFIDNGKAFIELNDEDISDVTYFYIRINKFVPESTEINNSEWCDSSVSINDCLCLGGKYGITECDIPGWEPMLYVDGKTTVFVNNNPLVLTGGGTMETGIPPCPLGLNEPLSMFVVEKKVTDYFYSEDLGNPSNDFLYPVETIVDNNNFLDDHEETLVKYNSDINIRVKVLWRGQNIPNGTPVYVSVGDNTASSLFVASQSVYYTTTVGEEYSYVDVFITARRYIEETRTEQIEIFSTYDENSKTERHIGKTFSITLDKKDKEVEGPPPLETDPSAGHEPSAISPYSFTMDRYNIVTDVWSKVANMSEAKGNGFSGSVDGYIYYMGGLLGNDLIVSNKNEQYDVVNDEWNDVSAMSDGRFGGMSITIGDDIYLIGGIFSDVKAGGNLSVTTLVEVYHADVDMWEELEEMPVVDKGTAFEEELGVAFGTATYVPIAGKNYIYVMGGAKKITANSGQFAISEYNQRILRYCVEDDEWEYSEELRSNELNTYKRISPLSIWFDDKVIVFSGAILSGNDFIYPSEDFYIDVSLTFEVPTSGQWLNFGSGYMGDYPVPKFQSAMAAYDLNPSSDQADYYIFGGFNDNSPSLDIVEKIKVKGGGFEYSSSYVVTDPSIDITGIPTGKHGANAEFSNATECIYLMGGYTINRDTDHIDISFDI